MRPHQVTFSDADFPHHFARVWSKVEGDHLRWIPYGMPRINQHLLNASFFLYEKNPHEPPDSENYLGPCGSGVIVNVRDRKRDPKVHNFYAVTAAHVARTGGSIIKVNTTSGKTRAIEFDPSEWTADLDWEDLAAVDITDRLQSADLISYLTYDQFATEINIEFFQIGVGEDGFMLGLFDGQPGSEKQNLIAARFGNISILANEDAPIERRAPGTGATFNSPCHVFDMHSRPGTSGSPVYVFRTLESDMRQLESAVLPRRRFERGPGPTAREMGLQDRWPDYTEHWEHIDPDSRFLKLLGIHTGQFHDEVTITKVRDSELERNSSPDLKGGDAIQFPGSMAIVVPAYQIAKLLEFPELKKQREERKRLAIEADLANPKRGSVVLEMAASVAPETDNPDHKEDFTSLLNAAARKRPQGD